MIRHVLLFVFFLGSIASAQVLRDFHSVLDYGAKGNTQEVTDAALSSGTSIVTSAAGKFVASDVGKACAIVSFTGQTRRWQGDCTITGYTSATTITISIAATAIYTRATFDWGTDDTAAITAAYKSFSKQGGILYFPPGKYMTTSSGVVASNGNVRLQGFNRYASVITGNHALYMFQLGSTTSLLSGLDVEDLGFDGLYADSAFILYGDGVTDPTFRNCRFFRNNTAIAGSFRAGTITDNLFETPGTLSGNGLSLTYGRGTIISENTCRFMNTCMNLGSTTTAQISEDMDISHNRFDGGWFLGRTAYTNSGSTVTYTSSALTDSAANFPTLTQYSVIRILTVRTSGTATSTLSSTSATLLTDTSANYTSAGVLRGDLVYMGTAVAMVDAVQNATHLVIEQWLDQTTRLPVSPTAGAYTVYKLVLGKYTRTGSSSTVLNTFNGLWFDVYGNTVTPAAGTLYEVQLGLGIYQLQLENSVSRSRVEGNSVKRAWADGISIYGNDITVIGNDVVDGQDEGITANGAHHTITGNHIYHQGTSGIYAACVQCTISDNNISYSSYTNFVNTVSLGDITVTGQSTANSITISGNVLDGGSNSPPWSTTIHRYGIVARGAAGGYNVSAVTIAGNQILNHTVADIQLDGGGGGTVSGIIIYGNSGTINAVRGATYSILGAGFYCADSGTASALACTISGYPTSYSAGQSVTVKVANTITGATTININRIGTSNVTKNGAVALPGALYPDMVAGGLYLLVYDGSEFVLAQNAYSTGQSLITSATGHSDVLCAKGADGTVFLSGVLNSVTVTTGTDTSLPNSGTWTTTGGSGTGANGTFTATGGNLTTVAITSGGSGYTSNPTFVPNSGSIGTSTIAFSSCVNTSNDTTETNLQLSWTQPANFWSPGVIASVRLMYSITTPSRPANLNLRLLLDASPVLWANNNLIAPTASTSNYSFDSRYTLIASGTADTPGLSAYLDAGVVGVPGSAASTSVNTAAQPVRVSWAGSHVLHPQVKWSTATAGDAIWLQMILAQLGH